MNSNYSSSIAKLVSHALYKTFGWVGAGLAITGVTSYSLSATSFMHYFFNNSFYGMLFRIVIMITQITLCFTLVNINNIMKYSYTTLATLFLLFSVTSGMSLAWIFVIYELQSIVGIFFITSGMFLGLSFYGIITKRDLSPMYTFILMTLFGIMIFSIINLFVGSIFFSKTISFICVAIFSLLTAMDIQKLKNIYAGFAYDTSLQTKLSIFGAVIMYQNFINIFIHLLHLFGKRKKN